MADNSWPPPTLIKLRNAAAREEVYAEEVRTRRSLGAWLAIGIVAIALITILVVGAVAIFAPDTLNELNSALQPGTIVVSCIAGLGALAALASGAASPKSSEKDRSSSSSSSL